MIECGERIRQALASAEEGLDSSRSHVRAAQLRAEISDTRQSLDAVLERAKVAVPQDARRPPEYESAAGGPSGGK
jgi:hypothetical protein